MYLQKDIATLEAQVRRPEDDKLTLEQFLNLSKQAGVIVQSAGPIIKDEITCLIFLNFSVDEVKVASYQLKPHFEEMLKSHQLHTSRGPGN